MKRKISFVLFLIILLSDIRGAHRSLPVSRGAEKAALKKPVIALARFVKPQNNKPYILLKLKKTDGENMQIYVAKESGRYRRLKLASSKLSDYKKGIKIRYDVKNKAVSLRVRTYQKSAGRTIYSSYSEPVHITRQRKIVKLNKMTCRLSIGNKTTLRVKGTKEKIKWSVLSGRSCVRLAKEKTLVHLTGLRAGKARVRAGVGGLSLTADITVNRAEKKGTETEFPYVSERPAADSAAPETTVPAETTGPTDTTGATETAEPGKSTVPAKTTGSMETAGPGKSTVPAETTGSLETAGPAKSITPAMSAKPTGTASAGVTSAAPAAERTKTPVYTFLPGSPAPTPVYIEQKEINHSLNVKSIYGGCVRFAEDAGTWGQYRVMELQGEEEEFELSQWLGESHVICSEDVAGYRWLGNGDYPYTAEDRGWLAAYPDLAISANHDGTIILWDVNGDVNFVFVKYKYNDGLVYDSDLMLYDVYSPYVNHSYGLEYGKVSRTTFYMTGNLRESKSNLQTIMDSVQLYAGPAAVSWTYSITSAYEVKLQLFDADGNSRHYILRYEYFPEDFSDSGIVKLYGDGVKYWSAPDHTWSNVIVYFDPSLRKSDMKKKLHEIKLDFAAEGYEYSIEDDDSGSTILTIKHGNVVFRRTLTAASADQLIFEVYPLQTAHPCFTSVNNFQSDRKTNAWGTWEINEENMERLEQEITILLSDKNVEYYCRLDKSTLAAGSSAVVFNIYMSRGDKTIPKWSIEYRRYEGG